MKIFSTTIVALICSISVSASEYTSKYVGEEHREIKSLSANDINELENGRGWGLAKVAELNGMPGPAHILEMEHKIHLSEPQKEKITALFDAMKANAIRLGKKLVELESDLDRKFANNTIDEVSLSEVVSNIENVRAELRIVHLSTHLQTPKILTSDQVALYNQLRGYSKNPCDNVPEGHSVEMWKKHNGCS